MLLITLTIQVILYSISLDLAHKLCPLFFPTQIINLSLEFYKLSLINNQVKLIKYPNNKTNKNISLQSQANPINSSMNRYKSSGKFNKNSQNVIIYEDQFDNELAPKYNDDSNIKNNPKYKSIPQKAALFSARQENQRVQKQSEFDDMSILKNNPSSEEVRLNNFFGSKKTLQRKIINNHYDGSPEYNPQTRQRRQLRTSIQEDTNEKLKQMIQKQIKQRQRWENIKLQKQGLNQQGNQKDQPNQNDNQQDPNLKTIESTQNNPNQLLIIKENESSKRINSKKKLTKINEEKFAANNIQKNSLFHHHDNQDNDYINPMIPTKDENKEENKMEIKQEKRKKRTVSELKPLKKKPSTFQVLNQLNIATKPYDSPLLSLADNNSSLLSSSLINRQAPSSTPRKTLNLSKTRIIGLDIKDFMLFAKNPLPKGKYIEGTVYRDRSGVDNTFFPQFRMQIDQINVIYSKKTIKGYDIFLGGQQPIGQMQKLPKIGSVKGNFVGSYYNVYEGQNQEEIVATVFYGSQMTIQSNVRDIEVYVRSAGVQVEDLQLNGVYNRQTNLKTLYNLQKNKGKINKYIPKKPIFDTQTGTYQLNFGTDKITMLSVKNIILLNEQNPKQRALVFGKSGWNNFYLRVQASLSPIVIMGYLMTSFNFKWVTQ